MWVEVDINGLKVYLEDVVKEKEIIESSGIIKVNFVDMDTNKEMDAKEVIERRIKQLDEVLKHGDKLKELGFKHVVLMGYPQLVQHRPKHYITAGLNFLAFYKRKPKFLQDAKPYS